MPGLHDTGQTAELMKRAAGMAQQWQSTSNAVPSQVRYGVLGKERRLELWVFDLIAGENYAIVTGLVFAQVWA